METGERGAAEREGRGFGVVHKGLEGGKGFGEERGEGREVRGLQEQRGRQQQARRGAGFRRKGQ
jgi:hypothetical protein